MLCKPILKVSMARIMIMLSHLRAFLHCLFQLMDTHLRVHAIQVIRVLTFDIIIVTFT